MRAGLTTEGAQRFTEEDRAQLTVRRYTAVARPIHPSSSVDRAEQEYCFQVLQTQPETNPAIPDLRPDPGFHRSAGRENAPFAPPSGPSAPAASFCVFRYPPKFPCLNYHFYDNRSLLTEDYIRLIRVVTKVLYTTFNISHCVSMMYADTLERHREGMKIGGAVQPQHCRG